MRFTGGGLLAANGVIGWERRKEVLEDMKEAVVTTRKEVGWRILLGDQQQPG